MDATRRSDTARPRVVIVGGGFAGLYAARALADEPLDVTLVDHHNHHLFQPLLYQVATAGLAAPDIAAPIRRILHRQENATVLLAEASAVDVEGRRLLLTDGALSYDYLVLAAGATHNYFDHPEWERHAPSLKNLEDAFEIRRRILTAFENAERTTGAADRRRHLTFAIVGAGPTGVELAGALREIATRTLARDFRHFDPSETRVLLVDAADRILPGFPERLSADAQRMLEGRGVEVRVGSKVEHVGSEGIVIDGEAIGAATVLWAAGVKASPLGRSLGAPVDRAGRVRVAPDLSVPGRSEIFVVGDLAAVEQDGEAVPGMAPAAIQEGRHAAEMIRGDLVARARRPFHYRDRGVLATIGRRAAVARVGRLELSGFFAWVLWMVVHIAWLIGFRNRAVVLFEWTWAYLTYQRSARVILTRGLAEGTAMGRATSEDGGRASRSRGG
jgi:NADH dehydrogenase